MLLHPVCRCKNSFWSYSYMSVIPWRYRPRVDSIQPNGAYWYCTQLMFQKVDFSPSPLKFPRQDDCSRSSSPRSAVISFLLLLLLLLLLFLKMPDFNTVGLPIPCDDDFNTGFNWRKVYDKRMVTCQGRSVWRRLRHWNNDEGSRTACWCWSIQSAQQWS